MSAEPTVTRTASCWSHRSASVSIGRPNSPESSGRGSLTPGRTPSIPATVASWSPRPRTRQPPEGLSAAPSFPSIEPGSLPGQPCDPDVPKRPAARRASSMTLARVRGTAPYAWSTVSCMVSSVRFGGGMGSRPRRAHSRLGGAAVVTGSGEVAPKLHGLSGPRRITPLSTDKTMPRSAREAGTWGAGSVSAVTWHSDSTVSSSSPRSRAQRREPPLVLAPGGTGKSAGS